MRSHAATDRRLEARRFRARREELARKVQGRCHCGAISYEAEVEPCTAYICHCQDCQMLTVGVSPQHIGVRRELPNSHRHAAPIHQGCRQRNEAGSRILRELWLTDLFLCAGQSPDLCVAPWWAEPAGAAWPAGAANLDETPAAVDAEARRRAGDRRAALNSRCVRSRCRPAPCPSMRRRGIFGSNGERHLLGDSPRSSGPGMSGCGMSNSIFEGSTFDAGPL